ncbi:amino acid ABC transporter substrate-binding protein [Weissella paramesenteroides]|uniref:amino acid ABC transporter substrate-binding protein n=1 Tax=Weissella paramesenteroides TaxID=1249 RepID=UPI00123B46C7|nr:amino acid ABC transporter substrate-binding protein [Weissella paramesenteroides]KAA8439050.1 amino acid ABC transporter substrate-binding protein [Weissella paramesenteroides]KAA8440242.1 amino acid ABC transporter substrate-binding protein [Weissella paramesenteroides]KAA8443847.1 amino acid ABC transporter substrate-binding protein [Weissella paramesenteroides]KAA8448928.1 amino acid ABC transporter substrate-binding protein [Weissella paramesenteroides]KAA8451398.1 amino acid ABC trans
MIKSKINWRRQIIGNGLVIIVLALIGGFFWYRSVHSQDTWRQVTADKTVVIGVDDTFVPMGFRDKSGKLIGYDVDLARASLKKIGLKAKFQPIDWSMKETELKTGHIDMIWNGYTINSDRKKKVAFSNPYHHDRQVIVTMKYQQINKLSDLKGKRLGAQTGSSGLLTYTEKGNSLRKIVGSDAQQYDTFDKALNDLQVGRLNAVLIDADYAGYYIAHEKDPEAFKIIQTNFGTDSYGVGMRKGDVTLRNKVNEALAQVKKDGTIDKISQRYFGTDNK